jgi:hypothetical protein
MNVSSRWCVTAVVALGALGCSDPVPPPAQGAFYTTVQSVSPPIAGKSCPSGTSLSYDVPHVDPKLNPPETLEANRYLHKIIDGQNGSTVRCSVSGGSTFTFTGNIMLGGQGLEISDGTLGADKKGTARITVTKSDQPGFSHSLRSPAPPDCTVDAVGVAGANQFQVKAGSMWASFSCPTVLAEPTDACKAGGIFVLENCDQ